jgi:hypothetical protein
MRSLRKFALLPAEERWLLVKSALLLQAISLGMWLLPFQTLTRLLAKVTGISAKLRRVNRISTERVVWAVEMASLHLPGKKTCLNQALAVQTLLARRGYAATLQIGVVKGEGGQFEAHAWVEHEGEAVIGGYELERYTRLVALEAEARRCP